MLSLVIQAGGSSRRMGVNKATLPFLGQPLITRVVERLSRTANEILITTNQPDELGFLGLPLYADIHVGAGALGGLHTALSYAQHPLVAVVACDMPFASAVLVERQLNLALEHGEDAIVPVSPDGFEPLHALYRKSTCLPAVENALQSGKRRMISWFENVKVRGVDETILTEWGIEARTFINVNTPEELAAAEQLAQTVED